MQVCAFFMGYSIDFSRFSTPTGVGSLSHLSPVTISKRQDVKWLKNIYEGLIEI